MKKRFALSQIMSINDELSNKRKHSLGVERNIDAAPNRPHWQLKSNGFTALLEKAIGLASLPLMLFLSFIFLCFSAAFAMFLALCRILSPLFNIFIKNNGKLQERR